MHKNTILIIEPEKRYHPYIEVALENHGCADLYELSSDIADIKQNKNRLVVLISKQSEAFDGNNIQVITAPYKVGHLLSIIQKLARKLKNSSEYVIGPYRLNIREMLLHNSDTQEQIILTDKEQEILRTLYDHNKPMDKAELLDILWGYADNVETHTLETHIYRLRQKIEKDPSSPEYLITVDDGYVLKK